MSAARSLGPRALVALAAGLCYAGTFRVPFLLDDPGPGDALDFSTRPLVAASFALNRWWSGGATWSYHLVNLGLHVATAWLLLALLARTLPRAAPDLAPRTRERFALVVTLAWTCHPLQTAAVTYLSQRAEILGSLCLLACLVAFVRASESPRRRTWGALSVAALVLGLATKQVALVAPALVLAYDATFLAPGARAALRARGGLHALLAATALLGFAVATAPLLGGERLSVGFRLPEFTALEYARTQPGVILHYLRLALWPHPLVFDHEWPAAHTLGDWLPQTLALAALLALTAWLLGRRSWAGFALASSFLVLAPTSSFVPIRDAAFEHRAYLPLAGWLVVLLGAGRGLAARWPPHGPRLAGLAAGGLVLALGLATVRRNRDYRSVTALWQTVVERAPHNERAYYHLATGLAAEGREPEAVAALEQALVLDPTYPQALNRLGNVYLRRGDFARAAAYLERAVAADPDPVYAHGLGNALLGAGELARAEASYRRALAGAPGKAEYHQSLAHLLTRAGRAEEAIAAYREALRLDPGLQESHTNLGVLLQGRGEAAAALEHHRRALALPPATPEEQFNVGRCLLELGRRAEAEEAFRAALAAATEPTRRARIEAHVQRALAERTPSENP